MKKSFLLIAACLSTACLFADKHNGHEYVDLGLPSGTLWATCNIGADTPEQAGDYFAWGEVETKTDYSWTTYTKYGTYDENNLENLGFTKYHTSGGKISLDSIDDAAAVQWESSWRIPTITQATELLSECNWEWIDNYQSTTIAGYIVTSKQSGNDASIFLPATGFYINETLDSENTVGPYWIASLSPSHSSNLAYYLGLTKQEQKCYAGTRCYGRPIRPVYKAEAPIYSITLDVNDSEMGTVTGDSIYEENAIATIEAIPNKEFQFKQWSDSITDNPRQIIVTSDTTLTAEFEQVTGLRVYESDKSVEVYWDKVEGASFYSFLILPTSSQIQASVNGSETDPDRMTYTISGLKPETTYTLLYTCYIQTTAAAVETANFTTLKEITYTGVEQVEVENTGARKVLENGVLYIVRNGEKYTIDGRKVH